ncbi:hypothetical protein AGMMS49960_19920 [Betaproteobacteria bacterium]|nr:hypothetical protein AGMMS49543_08040 [Betaproteobacteria bacterium]GHU04343.1 hypothetical protein AGMMS49960_19920 [Betaproteobacteria bacterium]GHU13975.1 hypothetical protein AGMMS50225_24920 [Betaproteobacteria bacterium]GHU17714.1 hypothetical protein AGMMS50243_06410 [Betaproteobacteria bacterium]
MLRSKLAPATPRPARRAATRFFGTVLFAAAFLCSHQAASAEETAIHIHLVAAADGAISALTQEEATQIFLGRRTSLGNGTPVTLIDLPPGEERNLLYLTLTGKNPVQVKAYWSRLVFSGRVRPPLEAANQTEAREWLAKNPNAIGYLPASVTDPKLKTLLTLP